MNKIDFGPCSMLLERKLLIVTTAALAGLGLLMVYSASITPQPSWSHQKFLLRQLSFLAAGAVLAMMASQFSADFWRGAARPLFWVSLGLLAIVLVPGIGYRINGAQRWFRIGPISIQASELAKLAIVLYLARALERKGQDVRKFWRGWLPLLIPTAVTVGLVLFEPDFGAAMFLMLMTLLLIFLAGAPSWQLAALGAAAVPVVGALVLTQPYRMKRVLQFADAWSDPASASYHIQQSLLAMGSGGLWGVGLGRGWQKLGFLPEANTDFLFAVLGEELGLVGTLAVLLLWATLLVCGIRLAYGVAHEPFRFLVSFGLVVQLALQAAINIGVVTASLPAKGMCLPFLSYGGSNLVVSLASIGVVLGLTREAEQPSSKKVRRPKRKAGRDEECSDGSLDDPSGDRPLAILEPQTSECRV